MSETAVNMKQETQPVATEIEQLFTLQKEQQYAVANTTGAQRVAKLKKLLNVVLSKREAIREALYKDFQKHPSEVDLTEIYPVTSEIKYVCRRLKGWMKKQKVATPMSMIGSSSYIHYEAKGVVLIIAPWNFPVNLTLMPLISAVAAGNTVILKPSESTPHVSAVLQDIVTEVFEAQEVSLIEGGIETAQQLLALPFNHIFFTGAPSIGKVVMAAAAKHLTSITLELGGKSPTIVDESANIDLAAKRIAWAKFMNNGQVCIAPDYLFVHQSKFDEFVVAVKKHITDFYGDDAQQESSYARVINQRHCQRVKSYIDEAVAMKAKVEIGGTVDEQHNYIAPTVMTSVPNDAKLMTEEIFGPVMPIQSYTDIVEVVDHINAQEKPLALYIYSSNKKNIKFVMDNTRAGGSCINHSSIHYFNHNLPFGGVNNSGIGKGHGWYGFETFSNARSVLQQHMPNALDMLVPPYNDMKQKLIDFTIKFF